MSSTSAKAHDNIFPLMDRLRSAKQIVTACKTWEVLFKPLPGFAKLA
jgi:hypothetical protein